MHRSPLLLSATLLVAASTVTATGGTLLNFTFTDDASSQISSLKTYTAKADPGSGGGVATVNGVVFDLGSLTSGQVYTAPGVTYTTAGFALSQNDGNNFDLPSGGVGTLLTDMVYTNSATGNGNVTTLRFTGLTLGIDYSARIYYRAWDSGVARPSIFNFDEDGAGPLGLNAGTIDEDAGNNSDGVANVIGYNFTGTGQDLVVTLTATSDNNSWHLYGMTNEVVPEPTSALLLAGGMVGLALRRRRSA